MSEVNEQIRQFILTNYLQGESPANVRDDTPLRTSGILDSLATLGLIAFVEREYRIELTTDDTAVERFDRIADIAGLIDRKQAGAG